MMDEKKSISYATGFDKKIDADEEKQISDIFFKAYFESIKAVDMCDDEQPPTESDRAFDDWQEIARTHPGFCD